ncbi:MAG: NUDIX hydrolase [Brevinematales bacterium]|nr:NUDIX hydrolase [Brevinematales bacterium]
MIRIRVQGLIFNQKWELLLVKHSKNGKEYYVLPGGGVEYREELEKALTRELKEELNIQDVFSLKFIDIREFIDPDSNRHILDLYYYVNAKLDDIKVMENDQIITGFGFFPIRELDKIQVYPSADYIKNLVEKSLGKLLA